MDRQFTIQRMLISVTAIGMALFFWMVVDLEIHSTPRRGFFSELLMFSTLVLRPFTVLLATISLLGFQRGLKAGILIICILVLVFWLILYVQIA